MKFRLTVLVGAVLVLALTFTNSVLAEDKLPVIIASCIDGNVVPINMGDAEAIQIITSGPFYLVLDNERYHMATLADLDRVNAICS